MGTPYQWAKPKDVSFRLADKYDAADEFNVASPDDDAIGRPAVTEDYALYIGVEGYGVLIEGNAEELEQLARKILQHVTVQLNDYRVESESRSAP